MIRTSETHPLQIAEVKTKLIAGKIGITFCPGKHDSMALSGKWARDLTTDLTAIKDWGAKLVLTLVEPEELKMLKVPLLGDEVQRLGMIWVHLPIHDYSVPDDQFEKHWLMYGKYIRTRLRNGDDIVIHCKGGLGRAGMIAARLLAEMGVEPDRAIRLVRLAREGAIETPGQLALVRKTMPITDEG